MWNCEHYASSFESKLKKYLLTCESGISVFCFFSTFNRNNVFGFKIYTDCIQIAQMTLQIGPWFFLIWFDEMFWNVLRYAGSLTDCNCSWSDIFPLSARTSTEGANFMSPKISIRLRFPRCISPSGCSTEDLQAALYVSMKIFFWMSGKFMAFFKMFETWNSKAVELLKDWNFKKCPSIIQH